LARGADLPLEGDLHSAQYFHGRFIVNLVLSVDWNAHGCLLRRDGLGNIKDRHPELDVDISEASNSPYFDISSRSSSVVIRDILQSRPARSVCYIALGPLTNLALALRGNKMLLQQRIGRIVAMGGALDVPGNTTPVAECKCRSHATNTDARFDPYIL
jgi:hypothetical protein